MMEQLMPKLRFPEFKDEWIEEILNNIVDVRDGTHDSPKYINDSEYFLLTSKNLNLNGKIDFKDVKYLNKKDFDKINQRSKVENNDILFGMIGTIGNPVIIKELKINFAIKNMALLKKSELILPEFLYQQFRSSLIDKQFNKLNTGNTQKFISLSTVRNLKVFNTSLEEQTKIADFLGAVDKQLDILNQKKEKLNTYKKGVMQQLFSLQLRFKDYNGNDFPEWEEKTLGDVFKITAGGDIKKEKVRTIIDDEFRYPIYANSDKNKGLFGFTNSYKIDGESITVTGRGNLGVAIDRNEKYYPIVRLLVLKPYFKTNVSFFKEVINTLNIVTESTGVPQLTAPQLSKYNVKFPSIEEQTKIAEFLSAIDKQIETVSSQIQKTEKYKKGLLQQMFV